MINRVQPGANTIAHLRIRTVLALALLVLHDPALLVELGLVDGDAVKIASATGSAVGAIQISDRMLPGHVSLPNGFGLDNTNGDRAGVAVNDLTSAKDRDKFAGTPFHKSVAVRLEPQRA